MKLKVILAIILSAVFLTGCTALTDTNNTEGVTDDTSEVTADTTDTTDTADTVETEDTADKTDATEPIVNTYRQISMSEAVEIMKNENGYIILDVRRLDEFEAGHIPNAINVPNEDIGEGEIAELPNKNQLILVYCRSGRRSKEASEKLVDLGYTNIVEFGGIIDWLGETEM